MLSCMMERAEHEIEGKPPTLSHSYIYCAPGKAVPSEYGSTMGQNYSKSDAALVYVDAEHAHIPNSTANAIAAFFPVIVQVGLDLLPICSGND